MDATAISTVQEAPTEREIRTKETIEYRTTAFVRFPRLLLISKDRSFGLLLREAMAFHHLTAVVEQAPTTGCALQRLHVGARWKIRLAIIALPLDQGGCDLVSEIRYHSPARAVPILMLDSEASRTQIDRAMGLGADAHAPQPMCWNDYGNLVPLIRQLVVLYDEET